MGTYENPDQIDFKPIAQALDEVPQAIVSRMKLERKAALEAHHFALYAILKLTVQVSAATWNSIRFLVADSDVPGRKPEFATAVPPLARTILDSVFTVVLLFDRPRSNVRWYLLSTWKEGEEVYKRYVRRHGADPVWRDWLEMHAREVEGMAQEAELGHRIATLREDIVWWPNPGSMASARATEKRGVEWSDSNRREHLAFLNDWFYKQLSGASHLSGIGLMERGGPFFADVDRPEQEKLHNRMLIRSNWVFTTLTIFLALLSEVVAELRLDHEAKRLRVVWRYLDPWPAIQDMYERRYRKCLDLAEGL